MHSSLLWETSNSKNLLRLTVTNLPRRKHYGEGRQRKKQSGPNAFHAFPSVCPSSCSSWNQVRQAAEAARPGAPYKITERLLDRISERCRVFCLLAAGGRLTSARAERLETRLKSGELTQIQWDRRTVRARKTRRRRHSAERAQARRARTRASCLAPPRDLLHFFLLLQKKKEVWFVCPVQRHENEAADEALF